MSELEATEKEIECRVLIDSLDSIVAQPLDSLSASISRNRSTGQTLPSLITTNP